MIAPRVEASCRRRSQNKYDIGPMGYGNFFEEFAHLSFQRNVTRQLNMRWNDEVRKVSLTAPRLSLISLAQKPGNTGGWISIPLVLLISLLKTISTDLLATEFDVIMISSVTFSMLPVSSEHDWNWLQVYEMCVVGVGHDFTVEMQKIRAA